MKKGPHHVLFYPLITEKSAHLRAEANSVAFAIHPKATKTEVKQAIEKMFKVKVTSIKTINCKGKAKRVGGREGFRSNWKKAYVNLAPGSSIDLIEGL